MTMGPVIAGAALGAVAADAYDDMKDKAKGGVGASTIEHGPVEMQMIVEIVANIEKAIKKAQDAYSPPDMRVQSFPADSTPVMGYKYKRRRYKHVSVLTASAITIAVRTDIGVINFNLSVGWNPLDMPDDCEMWTHGASATNVIVYWGDNPLDIPGV